MFDYSQARTHMLDSQILTNGIIDPNIIEAFNSTPREKYVTEGQGGIAYTDEDISLGNGRFIIEPMVHAKMLQAVEPKAHEIALDIGCASGYSSAILSPLVTTVVALEDDKALLEAASNNWKADSLCNIASFLGPLNAGYDEQGPYDLIFINGAVSEIPQTILQQLSIGGRLITVVKKAGQVMGDVTIVKRTSNNDFSSYPLFSAGTSYLPGFESQDSFEF